MLRVAFTGGRWLGHKCFEILDRHPSISLMAVDFQASPNKVYPGDEVCYPHKDDYPNPTNAENFKDYGPSLVISVLSNYIFKDSDLNRYSVANLHPAPLPEYRGCNSYSWAIENEEEYYGVSFHYVDRMVDTGPIIAQQFLAIAENETAWTLYKKSQVAAFNLFQMKLEELIKAHLWGHRLPVTRQDERKANYYRRDQIVPVWERHSERSKRAWSFPGYE